MKKLISNLIIVFLALTKLNAQCDIIGTLSVCVGSTTQLSGSGTPAATDPWVSATPGVASVDINGLVTGLTVGTSNITYTSTTCSNTVTVNVTAPNVNPTFTILGPYCVNDTPGSLPGTSVNGINGTWSPSNVNTTSAGITTFTFTPTAGQCATTATMDITVNAYANPAFNAIGPYCIGATPGALPGTSINNITGTWNPSVISTASAGTANYTFTPDAGQCANTTELTVVVNSNSITPTFATAGPYCTGATIPALPATSTNGITGTWSPSLNNSATTIYTFTPDAGQCAITSELTIIINPLVVPSFATVGPYCSGATIPALPTTSTNGITGTWAPAINNTATTTYTFTPTPGLCATTTTLTITINPNLTPTFTPVGPYCSGTTIPALPTTSTNEITGTWAPAINNTATTTYTFTPSAGLCTTSTTLTISITPRTIPAFTSVGPYCSGAAVPALPTTSTNGITGTWAPAINNTATTTYTFTPSAGLCATSTTLTISITPRTIPAFTSVGSYCSGAAVPALPTTSTNGITGTWTPAINNTATTTYTFTPTPGLCATTTTLTITINPNLTPTFTPVGPYCSGTTIPALPTTSTNGITGTWAPAINNNATTTYTFTPSAGLCATLTTLTIAVNVTPTAPIVGTITHPTCTVGTGSVVLNGLPPTGNWTVIITPGGTTTTGTGTSTTISGLAGGTYSFTVTNASGCTSPASADMAINTQPVTPVAPAIGRITHPTCSVPTGSIVINDLPSTGTWTLTINPGGTTTTGTGTSTTISGIAAGTYTFTVTNASGCISSASANVIINTQPVTPAVPLVGSVTHPTCSLATGSISLNGLPATGTWTLTQNPGGVTTTGTGTSSTLNAVTPGNYTFTVTNVSGCTSPSSASAIINANPPVPAAPAIGTITQPSCTFATGSVILNGLPATGTWTLTRTPGAVITTGTGISTTISGLVAGTYTFTVAFEAGCTSPASDNIIINTQPVTPTAPAVGTLNQPNCTVATGGVILNGLPATGTWTLTRTPGTTTVAGMGISTTISGLAAGTYTFTVTNASGCISPTSGNVVINPQPSTPTAPASGTITQPTCTEATGSVVINGLPATGNWTLTRNPGGITNSGTGTSTTISGIGAGTFTFTVTNASGCTSPISGNVVINVQPETPAVPVIGTITQPTLSIPTGSVVLNGLPATGTWILTRTPGNTITSGRGSNTTISGLSAGTYTFIVTNAAGCTSQASANAGLYTLTLFDPSDKILHPKDTIMINNSEAGSISISVESNTDWKVSDNSVWLKAVKENINSIIRVTFMENISAKDKVAALRVDYTSNPEMIFYIKQKARVSQLNFSKFENVKMYPNPAGNIVYLQLGEEEYKKIIITVADIQGHIVTSKTYNNLTSNQIIELDVSGFQIGQYLINIGDGANHKILQMIKN